MKNNKNKEKIKKLAHIELENNEVLENSSFLMALAEREEKILNGRLLSIIFIRFENDKSEISGYIDYAHRLK